MTAGFYIHVPFCLKKCVYCDFYSDVFSESCAEKYTDAVIRNLKNYPVTADTVYFGGGTPSLLSPDLIARILDTMDISGNAEVTMECNPATADKNRFSDYKAAGVNRVSIGVQSLCDRELSALGRLHNAYEAQKCITDAFEAGFDNISADIMMGIPYQTADTLAETIRQVLTLPVTHISAYMLGVEEGTPLAGNKTLLDNISDDDTMSDMYLLACKALRASGFERYEISNFARKGYECRHNLKYWRCEDYIGIGPAAHSCFGGKRYAVPKDTDKFISDERQTEYITDPAPKSEEERTMLMLRLSEGIPYKNSLRTKAEPLLKAGFLTEQSGRLILTDKGVTVSNEIIARLT